MNQRPKGRSLKAYPIHKLQGYGPDIKKEEDEFLGRPLPFPTFAEDPMEAVKKTGSNPFDETASKAQKMPTSKSGFSGSPIVEGIKAGADVLEAGSKLTKEISDAVDKARKTLHEISKENGALEVDLAENAKNVADKVESKFRDLSHNRYWSGGKFSPNNLALPRYGLTQDNMWKYENGQADQLPQSTIDKIVKANDDLRKYTLKLFQVNDNFLTRAQQRKLDAKKKELLAADFELKKAVELAKKAGLNIEYEDLASSNGDLSGFGRKRDEDPLNDSRSLPQSEVRRLYPNPDMMSGIKFC